MATASGPRKGTPKVLDCDLSVKSRRVLFVATGFALLYCSYNVLRCPDDIPHIDGVPSTTIEDPTCFGYDSHIWKFLCLGFLFALCCLPCCAIKEHTEFYELFPIIKKAAEKNMEFRRKVMEKNREEHAVRQAALV
eukprot:m.138979 g.138979  ORF g.138979 m.138979 type:complete len:136 (-) comp30028_c0_seq1:415-822(-)